MAEAIFHETPGCTSEARRTVLLAASSREQALRALLVGAGPRRREISSVPGRPSEQSHRASAEPALRNCLRCSKIECSTS
jgi:hypothetical protein